MIQEKTITVVNIKRMLPKNFGRHSKKSQHNVFMKRAIEYLELQGWKFPKNGITGREGRKLETGKILNLDCNNLQIWLNAINLVNRAVDLIHNYDSRNSRTFVSSASKVKSKYVDDIGQVIDVYLKELEEKEFWEEMREKYGDERQEEEFWASFE